MGHRFCCLDCINGICRPGRIYAAPLSSCHRQLLIQTDNVVPKVTPTADFVGFLSSPVHLKEHLSVDPFV